MIFEIYFWLLITWMVNQIAIEFYNGFQPLLSKHWWRQKLICPKCTAFWVTLAFTQNFVIAASVSMILHILNKTLENNNNEITL